MKTLLLCLGIYLALCAGCFPPIQADCITPGGLLVQHAHDQCDEVWTMQQRIEAKVESMGYRPHLLDGALLHLRRTELTAGGGFQISGGDYALSRGQTYCVSSMMIVAVLDDEPLNRTALAHEAFHLAQRCVWDQAVYNDCVAGGKDKCTTAATHPHWHDDVYPALISIDAEASR